MFSRICAFDSWGHSILSNQKLALWSAVAIVHFGGKFNSQLSTISEELENILNNLRAKILQDFKRGDIKENIARCWGGHAKSRRKILWLHFKVLHYVLSLTCNDLEFVNTYIYRRIKNEWGHLVWKYFLRKVPRTGGFCLVCERFFKEILFANFWRMSPRQLIL